MKRFEMVDICVSEWWVHRAEIESQSNRSGMYFGFILISFILFDGLLFHYITINPPQKKEYQK